MILETNCQARCKVCRRGTDHSRLRQEEQTEGAGQISPATNSFLLHQVWQRLPLTSWSAQPFKEVQISSNYGAAPSSPETDGCRRRRRRHSTYIPQRKATTLMHQCPQYQATCPQIWNNVLDRVLQQLLVGGIVWGDH